jgi:hypothetical protein
VIRHWRGVSGAFVACGLLAAPAYAGYVGTTPCGEPVRKLLAIKPAENCDVVRWTIWHMEAAVPDAQPRRLDIEVEIGKVGGKLRKLKRSGEWLMTQGLPQRPNARAVGMRVGEQRLWLWLIDDKTAYLLDAEQRLLTGNADYSYALTLATTRNRHAAKLTVPALPDSLTPLASGEDVVGIYEGRTPCALGQVLNLPTGANCVKLEWRLTLFNAQPEGVPTTYKLEGALFPAGPRTGLVSLAQSSTWDDDALAFKLEPGEGEQPLYLMVGDRNVLFFVDQRGRLGAGTAELNYVLSRVGP